jgi:Inner membrane protein YgaP-like, transmembrane domain
MIPANLGTVDRVIRLLLGVLLLGLYGALESPWKYITLLGLVLVATALSSFCPFYRLIGWSTRHT